MTDVTIRKLEEKDLFKGFLTSLDSLKKASDLNEGKAKDVFNKIKSNPNHLVFIVILDDKVIGATTLLIEPKFIHQGGKVGHIEDVVISKDFQGLGIGEKLINFVLDYSKKNNCYKTILDCSDDVKPFYEKIGFKKHSNSMRFDHS
jgi:glucosamine-phosphate N-acetyltransferase